MSLRPPIAPTFRSRWRFVILGLLLLAAAAGAHSSSAATGDYPSPLYLSGAASTLLGTSNAFVASPGPGQPATPVTLAPSAPTGAGLTGPYSYCYTVVDATGGETAVSNPTATNPSLTVTAMAITVSGLPTGVTVRLYRAKGGLFTLVKELPANSFSSYVDEMDDATAATKPVLPQAQNRIPLSTLGYQDFSPGGYAPPTVATAVSASISTTPSGKGWIAGGSGSVSFAQGMWTFQAKLKQNTGLGAARLVVGMWKVKVSGGAITSSTVLVDPTCVTAPCASGAPPGENTTSFNLNTNMPKTIVHAVTVNAFTLASDEHIYVQFWRHQTMIEVGGSPTNQIATLYGYDGITQISHPAANGFPNVVTLGSIPSRVNTTPALSATFSDPDSADTGTLSFQLCTSSDCTTLYSPGGTGSATGVANGANGTWTPSALPSGTYYWRAQSQDSAGNTSDWSAISSFTVDKVLPDAPTSLSPAASAELTTLQLSAAFTDTDPADSGTLSFQLCSDATCSSVVASNTTGSLANGASGSWTPSTADGTYRWRVRAQDAAGNASAWSSIRTLTLTPSVPTVTGIADGARTSALPTLSGTFSDSSGGSGSVTFQLCSDAACARVVASTTSSSTATGGSASWAPSLQDATYYARARAQDGAGVESGWSSPISFTIDTTPPAAPTVPVTRTRGRSAPLLHADASADTVRGVIQVCTDPACGAVKAFEATGAGIEWQAPALPDGLYYWRAFAADDLGNESGWSRTGSFVIDTVAPDVPALNGPDADARLSLLELSGAFASSDTGDDGKVGFQICTDAGCASVVTTSWGPEGPVGALIKWTAHDLADGTYFWRVSAQDEAGNSSTWSETRRFTLDTTAPARPAQLQATLSKNTLTLRWKNPTGGDQLRGYALYVNGKRTRSLAVGSLGFNITLRAHDRRTFAIAAIDSAGNVSARTRAVAVVPQLVNLTLAQAKAETKARNLVLRWSKKTAPSATRVVAQTPATLSLVDVGSAVTVVVAKDTPHRAKR